MKYPVFAIRDVKSGYLTTLAVEVTTAVAKRNFQSMVARVGSIFNEYPEDFELYEVGNFDTDTGIIESDFPKFICGGFNNG